MASYSESAKLPSPLPPSFFLILPVPLALGSIEWPLRMFESDASGEATLRVSHMVVCVEQHLPLAASNALHTRLFGIPLTARSLTTVWIERKYSESDQYGPTSVEVHGFPQRGGSNLLRDIPSIG